MVKAILLDCGGVLVSPSTGDWMLSPGFEAVLGEDFTSRHLQAFRKARRAFLPLLPDANLVADEAHECEMFVSYFRRSLAAINVTPGEEDLRRLAWLQVYRSDRYTLFADVLSWLKRWKGDYKLGIVSDAPPSTRRIMGEMGVLEWMDAATFSCEIGVLKPGAAIYRRTLEGMGIPPHEAVFIDDMPEKLRGGEALGIRGIQMRRKMPTLFQNAHAWDGPLAHDMQAADALIRTL